MSADLNCPVNLSYNFSIFMNKIKWGSNKWVFSEVALTNNIIKLIDLRLLGHTFVGFGQWEKGFNRVCPRFLLFRSNLYLDCD